MTLRKPEIIDGPLSIKLVSGFLSGFAVGLSRELRPLPQPETAARTALPVHRDREGPLGLVEAHSKVQMENGQNSEK